VKMKIQENHTESRNLFTKKLKISKHFSCQNFLSIFPEISV